MKDLSPIQKQRMDSAVSNMDSLIKQLSESESFSGGLRFNQQVLRASVIAEQFYCEKKIEMKQLFGRVETESKQQGSEGHESLLWNTVEVKRDEIFREIFSCAPVTVHEMSLIARYREVILAGQPDAIMFKDGDPIALFEYKFSNSPYPYRSYHVQARVYGRILEAMGFDTSDLFYIIAVVPKTSRSDKKMFTKIIEAVKENGAITSSLKVNDAHIYIFEYRKNDADRDIDLALEYWKGKRIANTVDNINKCRNCEYKEKCYE